MHEPFGVRILSGNLEEFVTIDGSNPPRPAMMGAGGSRAATIAGPARPPTTASTKVRETGFRCCEDPHLEATAAK